MTSLVKRYIHQNDGSSNFKAEIVKRAGFGLWATIRTGLLYSILRIILNSSTKLVLYSEHRLKARSHQER